MSRQPALIPGGLAAPLPEPGGPAMFEFVILQERPTTVDRYLAGVRGAAWSDRSNACIRGE